MSYLIPDGQYNLGTGGPDWLAMTEDSMWTNSRGTDTVYRMDPRNNSVLGDGPGQEALLRVCRRGGNPLVAQLRRAHHLSNRSGDE